MRCITEEYLFMGILQCIFILNYYDEYFIIMNFSSLAPEKMFCHDSNDKNVNLLHEVFTCLLSLQRPGECSFLRYSLTLEWENGTVTGYQPTNEHPLRFIYHNLSLNTRFTLKVSADGVMSPVPVCKHGNFYL